MMTKRDGNSVSSFTSKEAILDRYFAECTYTWASALDGFSEEDKADLAAEGEGIESRAFPVRFWA